MSYAITDDKEWEELKDKHDAELDDWLLYSDEKDGKVSRFVVYPFDYIKYEGMYTQYIGILKSEKDVPKNLLCIYRLKGKGNKLFKNVPENKPVVKLKEKRTKAEDDNSRLLDVTVKEHDKELMVILKELLKGITINEFKSAFTDTSEMNNIRREIEFGNGNCSWNRFTYILDKMGGSYNVTATLGDRVFKSN